MGGGIVYWVQSFNLGKWDGGEILQMGGGKVQCDIQYKCTQCPWTTHLKTESGKLYVHFATIENTSAGQKPQGCQFIAFGKEGLERHNKLF